MPPEARVKVWALIKNAISPRSTPERLLWALLFLEAHASEHAHSLITQADEKTFRKWTWLIAPAIADICAASLLFRLLIPRATRVEFIDLIFYYFLLICSLGEMAESTTRRRKEEMPHRC